MIYTLMVWTVIAVAGAGSQHAREFKTEHGWRPLAEFQSGGGETGEKLCENGAKQLGLKADTYRCVRTK